MMDQFLEEVVTNRNKTVQTALYIFANVLWIFLAFYAFLCFSALSRIISVISSLTSSILSFIRATVSSYPFFTRIPILAAKDRSMEINAVATRAFAIIDESFFFFMRQLTLSLSR